MLYSFFQLLPKTHLKTRFSFLYTDNAHSDVLFCNIAGAQHHSFYEVLVTDQQTVNRHQSTGTQK